MAKEESKKPAKKSVAKKFLSLFNKNPFITKKETLEEFKIKKEAEAEIMINAVQEILRKKRAETNDSIAEMEGGEDEVYLYDFVSEYGNNRGGSGFAVGGASFSFDGSADVDGADFGNVIGVTPNQSGTSLVAIDSNIEKIEPKVKLKPIDVWKELETIPSPIALENLEEKIAVLKMKKEFIRNNHYAKKEVIDMVTRLENRRKWDEFKGFFEKYDNTDTDKVNALINKYDLVLKTSDLFIPKFPKEAMDIMKEYKDNVKKLCGKSPVFYVIAEKSMFQVEDKRNDPILLVQSPFGIYWQILGAWDKELVLLEEL